MEVCQYRDTQTKALGALAEVQYEELLEISTKIFNSNPRESTLCRLLLAMQACKHILRQTTHLHNKNKGEGEKGISTLSYTYKKTL